MFTRNNMWVGNLIVIVGRCSQLKMHSGGKSNVDCRAFDIGSIVFPGNNNWVENLIAIVRRCSTPSS